MRWGLLFFIIIIVIRISTKVGAVFRAFNKYEHIRVHWPNDRVILYAHCVALVQTSFVHLAVSKTRDRCTLLARTRTVHILRIFWNVLFFLSFLPFLSTLRSSPGSFAYSSNRIDLRTRAAKRKLTNFQYWPYFILYRVLHKQWKLKYNFTRPSQL